jgi:hypothetical protein
VKGVGGCHVNLTSAIAKEKANRETERQGGQRLQRGLIVFMMLRLLCGFLLRTDDRSSGLQPRGNRCRNLSSVVEQPNLGSEFHGPPEPILTSTSGTSMHFEI